MTRMYAQYDRQRVTPEKQDLTVPSLPPLVASKTPLHDKLGVSPTYTRGEYMKIVNQDENLAVKLKAIAPLARELGLEADPTIAATTQTIIFMMPQEISQKHNLIDTNEKKIIDV